MNGCYYNEKTADEMFEELGYKKHLSDKKGILFFYIRSSNLSANEMERIIFYKNKTVGFDYVYCSFKKDITMQELQAINKKVQELGWIHEREEKENERDKV